MTTTWSDQRIVDSEARSAARRARQDDRIHLQRIAGTILLALLALSPLIWASIR